MSDTTAAGQLSGEAFDALVRGLRPRLHRYCARMVGSAVDGEDVLQDALVKALGAAPDGGPIAHPEAWLFRIAHNAALDFLRRRQRAAAVLVEAAIETVHDEVDETARREVAAVSLRAFMELSPAERSSVILMDVLGHSLREIGDITGMTVPAVKASLHRGRSRLLARVAGGDGESASGAPDDVARLKTYVDRFNARDFDAVRAMLAEDVRLELVDRARRHGKAEVSIYFSRYAELDDWHLALGFVDGRLAILGEDPADPGARPRFFVLLGWAGDQVATIRDFRHAPYNVTEAVIERMPPPP
jgi:RNA polymerase sigma-70 factor (ECF subfamily)